MAFSKNKIDLHQIPEIEEYRLNDNIILSSMERENIQNKLQIQRQTKVLANERLKTGDTFVKFSSNPFSSLKVKPHAFSSKYQSTKASQNIIEEINSLKKVQKPLKKQFISEKNVFIQKRQEAQYFSNGFCADKNKGKAIPIPSINTEDIQESKTSKQDYEEVKKNQVKIKQQMSLPLQHSLFKNIYSFEENTHKKPDFETRTLDQILKMDENSYFLKSREGVNIFAAAYDTEGFLSPTQILDSFHFSFNSVIDKINTIKIPVYREISELGRKIICGIPTKQNIINEINSVEISFKLDNLITIDVLNVASGRFSSEFVSSTTDKDGTFNLVKDNVSAQDSSQEGQQQIIYRSTQKHQGCRYHETKEQEYEIQAYLKLPNLEAQQYYAYQCERKKKYFEEIILRKQTLYDFNIKDKNAHLEYSQKLQEEMQDLIGMDSRQKELDRVVRKNKIHKQRNEAIKLKYITKVLDAKQQHENNTKDKKI